jgi:glutamate-ammonia-ligase adenylyltransferase
LKRGPGGLVDVEFIAQMLQLKHGREHPEIRTPATLDALAAMEEIGAISREDFDFFSTSYRVLLAMVSRLRLMNTTARHDLPEDAEEQSKLARLLEYPDREKMLLDCEKLTRDNRARFERIFAREARG